MEINIIKSKKQYHQYLNRMLEIFDAKKGTPESEELDLLALVIEKYEEEKFQISSPDPIEAIRFIMEQNNLNDGDLGKILKSRSHTSEILNKKRKLNLNQIRMLTQAFNIPADILIRDYELS
ncbi:HTH-type transcriptional regulator/antitoxin HigA [Flavobacteriaceae bacterium MAR_2009_75]|nr:HTH-type transcriptional regulator/antitoxin HigA [Flavobacteriaceae bacterium MAR_2009_75]